MCLTLHGLYCLSILSPFDGRDCMCLTLAHMSSSATASNIKTGIVQSNIEKSVVLLSIVHCIHRYPWTVHGTLYPQISMDCPQYIVPTDIHGLSMVHCTHRYPWTVLGTPMHVSHITWPLLLVRLVPIQWEGLS